MIRVALITHRFPSREHPYILDWVRSLARRGLEITVITEREGEQVEGVPTEGTTRRSLRALALNRLDEPASSLARNAVRMGAGLANLPGFCRGLRLLARGAPSLKSAARQVYEYLPAMSRRFDIVHFNAPQIAARRFELGRLLGGRTVVSFRGQDFSFHPTRYDRLLDEADHLHFLSEHLVRLARTRGYDGAKHSVIPPLVDADFYRPGAPRHDDGPAAGRIRLFTAARFTWTKGWEFALEAVALVARRYPAVSYEIAGDGEFRDAVRYTIAELGLEQQIRLLGWRSPEEIRKHMQDADLYVLASVEEAFNNSVLQAQACGLPVVCSDAGGLPENIEDGVTGLLARRRDAWDLAQKILDLIANSDRRRAMGEAARRRAVERFALASQVERFAEMYRLLVPLRGRARVGAVGPGRVATAKSSPQF